MKLSHKCCATLTAQFNDDGMVIRDRELRGSFADLLEDAQDWGSISNPGHTYYVEVFDDPNAVYGRIFIWRDYAKLCEFLERCTRLVENLEREDVVMIPHIVADAIDSRMKSYRKEES